VSVKSINKIADLNALHRRKSVRLRGYDYTCSGYYFVTICTVNRQCLLGQTENGLVRLNCSGEIVKRVWQSIPVFCRDIEIDEFVVMPNHLHGIVVIPEVQPGSSRVSLSVVMQRFKSMVIRELRDRGGLLQKTIWQRSFNDHIIRNNKSLNNIRQYIRNNPTQWMFDCDYVGADLVSAR